MIKKVKPINIRYGVSNRDIKFGLCPYCKRTGSFSVISVCNVYDKVCPKCKVIFDWK